MYASVKLSFYSVLLVSKADDTLIASTISFDKFFLRKIFIETHLIFAKNACRSSCKVSNFKVNRVCLRSLSPHINKFDFRMTSLLKFKTYNNYCLVFNF